MRDSVRFPRNRSSFSSAAVTDSPFFVTPLPARRPRTALAATLVASVQLCGTAGAATDPYVGASVTGSAKVFSLICGTCPIDASRFPTLADGGPGFTEADIGHAEPGYAALSGPNDLPALGASASTDVVVDPSIPKTYFYGSSGCCFAPEAIRCCRRM